MKLIQYLVVWELTKLAARKEDHRMPLEELNYEQAFKPDASPSLGMIQCKFSYVDAKISISK